MTDALAQKTDGIGRHRDKRLIFVVLLSGLALAAVAILLSVAIRSYLVPPKLEIWDARAPTSREVAELLRTDVLPISEVEAEAANAARPLDLAKLTSARPFVLASAMAAREAAIGNPLRCLTQAVYYEAASESDVGQRGVAQVVLNRMRHPAFPNSVCGVVYQGSHLSTGCQFSFTCDGSLARVPSASGWARAQRVAAAALSGWVEPSVGLATHYHANYVVPYWASSLYKVRTLGAHIFYVMRGRQGQIQSFSSRYDPSSDFVPGPAMPGMDTGEAADIDLLALEAADVKASPELAPLFPPVREDSMGTLIVPMAAKPDGTGARGTDLIVADSHGKLLADEGKGVLQQK